MITNCWIYHKTLNTFSNDFIDLARFDFREL